jgi:hypothetical protein
MDIGEKERADPDHGRSGVFSENAAGRVKKNARRTTGAEGGVMLSLEERR